MLNLVICGCNTHTPINPRAARRTDVCIIPVLNVYPSSVRPKSSSRTGLNGVNTEWS